MLTGLSTEFGNSVYEMSGNFPDESSFISSHSSQLKSKEIKNSAAKKMKSSKDKIQSKIDKNRSENGSNLFEILSKTLSNLKSERSVMTEQEDDIKAADIDTLQMKNVIFRAQNLEMLNEFTSTQINFETD